MEKTLSEWLLLLEQRHPSAIDLGLERVASVAAELQLDKPTTKVITVAGTNGKGSCVAVLEALLLASAVRVGTFTSPHLLSYNERIRIQGKNASDADICRAFSAIEQARGEISLTYFEFSALAALYLFSEAELDVIVLEVGLGGCLDAVNIVDPDVAVITSIDLDHQEWLGNSRSAIAVEKAGIARPNIPLICTDANPPEALLTTLDTLGANVILLGQEGFAYQVQSRGQSSSKQDTLALECRGLAGEQFVFKDLPAPQVPITSAVCAVQALFALEKLPPGLLLSTVLTPKLLAQVFSETIVPGRFQQSNYRERQVILDVAHNPAAATLLSSRLVAAYGSHVHCVFGALADKDIAGMIKPLVALVSHWHLCALPETTRSAETGVLAELVYNCVQSQAPLRAGLSEDVEKGLSDPVIQCYDNPEQGLNAAIEASAQGDVIVVFGSFYTVAAILKSSTDSVLV